LRPPTRKRQPNNLFRYSPKIRPCGPAFYPTTCRAVALAEAEAFPVEVEVNRGWGDTMVVVIMPISPIPKLFLLLAELASSNVKQSKHCYGLVLTDYWPAAMFGV
jgi:hypothetical protein